ncbi:hypothetical protein PG995_003493 [Apiospora arundinis]
MCKQRYLTFASCGCQLRHGLEPCAHGPASPECPGRRTQLVPAGRPLCFQHAYYEQQRARARERRREQLCHWLRAWWQHLGGSDRGPFFSVDGEGCQGLRDSRRDL